MAELFRVTDRWDRVIVLTDERWWSHVVANHPDFATDPSIVADAITAPEIVTHDRRHPDRELFYGPSRLPYPLGNRFVRVIVGSDAIGFVITAHLIGEPHRKEKRKWP